MYIYNITMIVDHSILKAWNLWIESYIKQLLSFGHFSSAKLTEVLVDDAEGKTFSIQFTSENKKEITAFLSENKATMQQVAFQKFGSSLLTFDTELKVINTFPKA